MNKDNPLEKFFGESKNEDKIQKINEAINVEENILESSFRIQCLTYLKSRMGFIESNNKSKELIAKYLYNKLENEIQNLPIDTILKIWRELDNTETKLSQGIFSMLQKQVQINVGPNGAEIGGSTKTVWKDSEEFADEETKKFARKFRTFLMEIEKTEGLDSQDKLD